MFKRIIKSLLVLIMLISIVSCGKKEEQSINVYNAGAYIDETLLQDFSKQTGIKVNYDTFPSNEDAYIKLSNNPQYDIVIPSDYMIEQLANEDIIKKLDKSQIDVSNIYQGLNKYFTGDLNDFAVPYFWGNVGIVYDSTKIDQKDVETQGWEVLRNEKYKGMLYMYNSARDSFMVAEKALGYSVNTTSSEELDKAKTWLEQLCKTMNPSFVTDEVIDSLAGDVKNQEGKYYSYMYSGDAAYVLSQDENMKFFVPKEGTNIWVDGMCLLTNTKKDDLCYKFINFMLDEDNAYANSLEVGYASPISSVLETMSGEDGDYYQNDAYFPRSDNDNDEVFHMQSQDLREYVNKTWNDIVIKYSAQ